MNAAQHAVAAGSGGFVGWVIARAYLAVGRRRWQVVTTADLEATPERLALAWTEAGAWRKARRIRRRNPSRYGRYYCGNLMPIGATSAGWFEVRPRSDGRSMFEVLTEEANRAG